LLCPKGLPVEVRNARDAQQLAKSLSLTAREREVLQSIAEGQSGKEIAHALAISVKTVEYHRQNIKRKLGVSTVAELTRNAMAGGLV
jgi:DNA-binding CsgD family transcriptional regulator